MNKRRLRRVIGSGTSLFIALILCTSSFLINNNITTLAATETGTTRPTPPSLATPNEVQYDKTTTSRAYTPWLFLSAYRNEKISRIILGKDLDLTSVQTAIRRFPLKRSIQIDGDGYTLKSTSGEEFNEDTMFNLDKLPAGRSATIHLKNLKVWARGSNYVDNGVWGYPRGEGWQLILEDVNFEKNPSAARPQDDRALRVARLGRGHIFLRGIVNMVTSGENFYAGQITVAPNARVYGENDYYNFSTWWFTENNAKITSVDSTVNIGQGAHVELHGLGGGTYPAIYEHWRAINVHPGATLKTAKPGHAYEFKATTGITDKYINVFEGATIEGTSTGGAAPIMDEYDDVVVSHFYAAPKSIVKFIGKTNDTSKALIDIRNNGSTLELEQPAIYDIRNNLANKCQEYDEIANTCKKPGSAKAQAVNVAKGSHFILTSSDVEVWDTSATTKDLSGTPDYGWYQATVIADNTGKATDGTEDPHHTSPSLRETWNTNNYARITGVNDRPVIAFDDLTDADKSYIVNATVLGKPAWWKDQVTIHVTNDKSEDEQDGKNDADGKFKYTLPNGEFFKAGTTYTTTGYRGVPAWSALNEVAVTVRDVTPPKPVKINTPIYHLTEETEEISGTDGEPGATVSAALNNEPLELATGIVVQQDGTWAFALPDTVNLQPNDVIQVFLTDKSGNTTPAQTTSYKDAIFEGATKITFEDDTLPPVLTIKRPITYEKCQGIDEARFFKDIEPTMNKRIAKIESDFAAVVQFDALGAYSVNVTAYDRAGNWDKRQTTVLITDADHTKIDEENKMLISAYDFTIQLSDVPNADFIALAEAQAWHMSTTESVEVQLMSAKPTTGGVHEVTFRAGKTSKSVKVTVVDDVAPILSVDARVIYETDTAKTDAEFLKDVHAALDEAGTISSDFASVVDLSKVGTYVVSITGADIAGNKASSAQTKVFVKDENTIIDEDEDAMMSAHDFTLLLSRVPSADFIALAEAQAWHMSTTEPVEVQLMSTKPTIEGVHKVIFSAGKISISVQATVVDDTIVLEANDVNFSFADFNRFKTSNQLASEVLNRAQARAYVKGTGEEIKSLIADVTELLTTETAGGGTFDIPIYYDETPSVSAFMLQQAQALNEDDNSMVIKVSIEADKGILLPITGEDVTILVAGLVTFISSLVLLFFLLFQRRRKKEQEQA